MRAARQGLKLTDILKSKAGAAFFKSRVHRPAVTSGKRPLKAPLIGQDAGRIGTAFDYALRFGLAEQSSVKVGKTIAEEMVRMVPDYPHLIDLVPEFNHTVDQSIETLRSLSTAGELKADAARASLILAAFDTLYRVGRDEQLFLDPTAEQIADVQALYKIIPWEEFQPRDQLILNPTFANLPEAVAGADGDLLIDARLIEIKTSVSSEVKIFALRQLAAYAVMANRYGFRGLKREQPVSSLGIYLSRCGELLRFELNEVSSPAEQAEILKFLNEFKGPI